MRFSNCFFSSKEEKEEEEEKEEVEKVGGGGLAEEDDTLLSAHKTRESHKCICNHFRTYLHCTVDLIGPLPIVQVPGIT